MSTRAEPPSHWVEVLRWDEVTGQWAEVDEAKTKPDADLAAVRHSRQYPEPGRYLVREVTEQVLTFGQ